MRPAPRLSPADARTVRAVAARVLDAPAERFGEPLVATFESLLSNRPARLRRGLLAFVWVVRWLPAPRWGRRFDRLPPARQDAFLRWLQGSRLLPLRLGFWGLRSLILIAYYGALSGDGRLCEPPGRDLRAVR